MSEDGQCWSLACLVFIPALPTDNLFIFWRFVGWLLVSLSLFGFFPPLIFGVETAVMKVLCPLVAQGCSWSWWLL